MPRCLGCCLAIVMIGTVAHVFASDVPTTLSGTWTGAIKVSSYKASTSSNGKDTSATATRNAGTLTVTFLQTGSALTVQATVVAKDKSGATNTLTGSLAGVYGNGNFWALGITSNANDSVSIVLTGHANGKTIGGIGIGIGSSDELELSYMLKPSSTKQSVSANTAIVTSLCGKFTAPRTDTPVAVLGTATGKLYTIGTAGKAIPIRDAVTGTISVGTSTETAVLMLADSTGSDTFTLTGPSFGKSVVVYGPNSSGTSQAVFSVHAPSSKTAKGIGILYNNGALIEYKLSLKQ